MITFLIVTALVIAFVVGSALAMRPSPRLRRLAELRQRAVVEGLRVQLRPGEREVDYSLGWRVIDAGRAPGIRLAATRGEGGLWQLEPCGVAGDEDLVAAMGLLPSEVCRIAAGSQGVVACWNENGTVLAVQQIAVAMRAIREALARRA